MAIIHVNYTEPDASTYRSVSISYANGGKSKVFKSGNFVKDWFQMKKFLLTEEAIMHEHHISCSSDFDHFFMDGAQFDSAWLVIVGDEGVLVYKENADGDEHFVPKGTQPTWKELKDMCNNPLI